MRLEGIDRKSGLLLRVSNTDALFDEHARLGNMYRMDQYVNSNDAMLIDPCGATLEAIA